MKRQYDIKSISYSKLTAVRDTLPDLLRPFGVEVTEVLQSKVLTYMRILMQWNEKISLTSITNPVEIVRRHFGESFFAAQMVQLSDGRLADVGSGAGFPGLALMLIAPQLDVSLIEASVKKAAFLYEIQRQLELRPVRILRTRLKDVSLPPGGLDYVTARAVGSFEEILDWASAALRPGGCVLLWLGTTDASRLRKRSGWQWNDSVPIPLSRQRVILVGRLAVS